VDEFGHSLYVDGDVVRPEGLPRAGQPAGTFVGGLADDAVLRRARTEAEVFGLFFDRYATRVHRYFVRAVGNQTVATDLTAETFAQALVSLERFRGRGDGSGAAWLFGIARRVLLRSLRDQRREVGARRRLQVPVDAYAWDEAQSDARLDRAALGGALAGALASLTDAQAAAVRLRVIEQLDYGEVGRALGCSSVAARIRVSRGLRALLEHLEGEIDA
jgi:RNA polymerase sigma factor (sigma-70 family)